MPEPLVLGRETLRNAHVLETRTVPRRVLGRVFIVPRGTVRQPVFWRLLTEMGIFRYGVALLPFPIIAILRPSLALPIAQAPLLMLIAIWFFESRVLGLSDEKREALLSADDRDRVRDMLKSKGMRALSRIAAGRDAPGGEITLVVEQSELARLPVLTLISVQRQLPDKAEVLDLTAEERQSLLETLFDDEFTPDVLHALTLATKENLHKVDYDTRSLTAHQRLAAMAGR